MCNNAFIRYQFYCQLRSRETLSRSGGKENFNTWVNWIILLLLTSVPTMVVNGKYLIDSKSLDRSNFFAEYNELVAYLFTL